MIGLAVRREAAAAHICAIVADSLGNDFADIGILARKLGCLVESEAEDIVHHQDLAVAVGAGANSDGGNAQLAGDLRGQFARAR